MTDMGVYGSVLAINVSLKPIQVRITKSKLQYCRHAGGTAVQLYVHQSKYYKTWHLYIAHLC